MCQTYADNQFNKELPEGKISKNSFFKAVPIQTHREPFHLRGSSSCSCNGPPMLASYVIMITRVVVEATHALGKVVNHNRLSDRGNLVVSHQMI